MWLFRNYVYKKWILKESVYVITNKCISKETKKIVRSSILVSWYGSEDLVSQWKGASKINFIKMRLVGEICGHHIFFTPLKNSFEIVCWKKNIKPSVKKF